MNYKTSVFPIVILFISFFLMLILVLILFPLLLEDQNKKDEISFYDVDIENILKFEMKDDSDFWKDFSAHNVYIQLENGQTQIVDTSNSISKEYSFVKKGVKNQLITKSFYNDEHEKLTTHFIFNLTEKDFAIFNEKYANTFIDTLPLYNEYISNKKVGITPVEK